MSTTKFSTIVKKIQVYGYENSGCAISRTGTRNKLLFVEKRFGQNEVKKFTIDHSRYQINPITNKDYSFLLYRENNGKRELKRYALLNAYLHGAIINNNIHDETFTSFQKNELGLLFGTYAFVDEENKRLHYLLGPYKQEALKPSFNFKTYYNIENHRGQEELLEIEPKIIKLLYNINQRSRESINDVDNIDFYKIFNNKHYDSKRDPDLEKKRDIVYVSSGEADHCVLQWILLNRKAESSETPDDIKFNFSEIYDEYKSIFQSHGFNIPYINSRSHSGIEWLKEWGLISANRAMPTERMLAVLEWFYYYLKGYINRDPSSKKDEYDLTYYLDLVDNNNERNIYPLLNDNDSKKLIKTYIKTCEGCFTYLTSKAPLKRDSKHDSNYLKNIHHVIGCYLDILYAHQEPADSFKKRCRFNPSVHFLYRNCLTEFYWGKEKRDEKTFKEYPFKEVTCRGLIYIPVLNKPDSTDTETVGDTKPKPIGYFVGHIKDSDYKGKSFYSLYQYYKQFNKNAINNFYFENRFYDLNHIVTTLARIEREEVYVKGILIKSNDTKQRLIEESSKKSFSLTTHSLKTELKTTLIPQIASLIELIEEMGCNKIYNEEAQEKIRQLEKQCNDLYGLTGVITLVDKVKDQDHFTKSGLKDNLLSKNIQELSIQESYLRFHKLNPSLEEIRFSGGCDEPFNVKVYDHYLSQQMIKLLHFTIFDNLILHSKRKIDGSKKIHIQLDIEKQDHVWSFKNETRVDKADIDEKSVKGNLGLFKHIIELTGSGTFKIITGDGIFKIIYKPILK